MNKVLVTGGGGYIGIETAVAGSEEVPAADRYVSLDHNSLVYQQAIDALKEVAAAVRGSNEYAEKDPEDREQRLAEIEAGDRL